MLSSTSSSEAAAGNTRSDLVRATKVLLVAVLALLVTAEIGARLLVPKMSNTLSRIRLESNAARALAVTSHVPKEALIVGNSLLIAGVDVDQLNRPLEPEWRGVRFGMEQTTYYDWYFGMKRLTADGSRPSAFVVCFEPRHLIGSSVRTELFAHYLMRTRDTLDVARALDLTPSATADLFAANVSAFWALRKEIRKNVLGRLLPSMPELTRLITRGGGAPAPQLDAILTVGRERLMAMRAIAAAADAKLIVVLMPPVTMEYTPALQRLGRELGVPILTPLTDQDLAPGDYEPDQYHLNSNGRLRFTSVLAGQLRQALQ
ncbi:hypothetical protein [Steroidobacter cummioxidans]|uniref:hypothetical protein n=1 Tax=Steroidobacter cummioxidans TaxID=1803913 RepID=UPI000E3108AA|nr:hypothetical protein [Steroidobacter cummioxidans]